MNENEMKKTSGMAQLFETLVALLKRLFGGSTKQIAEKSAQVEATPKPKEAPEVATTETSRVLMEIKNHTLVDAKWCPSPNFNERPDENDINLLVVHNISLPPRQFGGPYIEELFCNTLNCTVDPSFKSLEGVKVSAHLLIRRDGQILQFVPFNKRAWHAGVSEYDGRNNCNDFSIGIELEGADDIDYEPAQYQVLAEVTDALLDHYPNMAANRIAGHCDIAPKRKTDPGQAFDWSKYKKLIAV